MIEIQLWQVMAKRMRVNSRGLILGEIVGVAVVVVSVMSVAGVQLL